MDESRTPKTHEIRLSPHSVERFRERVRPTLSIQAAAGELKRLLDHAAQVGASAPEWLARTMAQASPFYATVGEDLVLPLAPAGGGWVALTCLSRGYISEPARERRNRNRRVRSARRRARREGGRRSERCRVPR